MCVLVTPFSYTILFFQLKSSRLCVLALGTKSLWRSKFITILGLFSATRVGNTSILTNGILIWIDIGIGGLFSSYIVIRLYLLKLSITFVADGVGSRWSGVGMRFFFISVILGACSLEILEWQFVLPLAKNQASNFYTPLDWIQTTMVFVGSL